MARPEAVGWWSLVPVHDGDSATETKGSAMHRYVGRGAEAVV